MAGACVLDGTVPQLALCPNLREVAFCHEACSTQATTVQGDMGFLAPIPWPCSHMARSSTVVGPRPGPMLGVVLLPLVAGGVCGAPPSAGSQDQEGWGQLFPTIAQFRS